MIRSVATACAFGLTLATFNAQAIVVELAANLTAAQEVPHDSTSDGFGTAGMVLDTETGDFGWMITYAGLDSALTGAHFHAAAIGEQGSIVLSLIPPDADPDRMFTNPIVDSGPSGSLFGSAVLSEDEIDDVLANLWYVNLHTDAWPAGAIRGQVMRAEAGTFSPVPLPAAAWLLLSALGGIGVARWKRARRG